MTSEQYTITVENECTLVRKGDFVCFANDTATLVDLLNLQDKKIQELEDEMQLCRIYRKKMSEIWKEKGD